MPEQVGGVMLDVEDAAVVTFAPCGKVVEAGAVETVALPALPGCRRVVMARPDVKTLEWCVCEPGCWEVA